MHRSSTHVWLPSHSPQTPPQPSSPHVLFEHAGVQSGFRGISEAQAPKKRAQSPTKGMNRRVCMTLPIRKQEPLAARERGLRGECHQAFYPIWCAF